MDKITRGRFIKKAGYVLGGIVLFSLTAEQSGCKGTGAMDTPIGPVFWGGAKATPFNVKHEECHDQLRRKMGSRQYFRKYFEDDRWACQEEIRCGATMDHPACRR